MKIAIYGYGNLGRGVECATKYHTDAELVGIFTRRAPESVKTTLGVPVYQLLGGKVNDKCRIYVNGWFSGAKTPEEFGEKAKIAVQRGVTAMKWDPFGKSYLQISNKDLDKALRCIVPPFSLHQPQRQRKEGDV